MTTPSRRILVVDDEQDTCANLADILSDLGYEVDIAHDGLSALQQVRQHVYDIALLDLRMPGMDGVQLYREIKRLQADTVAIIVTAYAEGDSAERAMEAGAWRTLSKPVNLPLLLNLMDEALDQPMVLIVDDDQELCNNLWEIFRERGFRAGLAHGVSEASQLVRQRDYRVVLIDMRLPHGDGGEVFQCVREASPTARTVIITGHRGEMEVQVDRILSEGADAVCYKPFDVNTLLNTVRQLAEGSESQA
jgi:two-component system, NtrC family, response regulator HydG